MTVIASAPGKIILFGEHAVVYGHSALAVPVTQVQATCRIEDVATPTTVIHAPDIDRHYALQHAPPDDPLATIIRHTLDALQIPAKRCFTLTVTSTIPIACGLGSGAAISTAVVRALAAYFQQPLADQAVSDLVFEVEKIYHGTPSGIDNTVIAFAQPVSFARGKQVSRFTVKTPLTFVIADTGIKSPTHKVVGDLRHRRDGDRKRYDGYFESIGELVRLARSAIEGGNVDVVAQCMLENHAILDEIGVSSPELNALVAAAMAAGATGAKLSGAGWGGNMIALAAPNRVDAVATALKKAGAVKVIVTTVG